MHSQSDKQKEELKESLFEHALKRISVQAFDALLTCGVRDFAGFLRLTGEDLHQGGVSPRITTELMGIQLELCEHTTKSVQGNNGIDKGCIIDRVIQGEQQVASENAGSSTLELLPATLIPNDLMERLSTRARNVLIREKILTCERLLEFHEEDLYGIAGIGRKTVLDIKRLQDKVSHCSTEFSQISVKTAQHAKPKNQKRLCCYPRGTFSLRRSDRQPSDPAGWSLLSLTLSELFQVTTPRFNILIGDDDEQATIGSLEIPSVDINSLLEIVLFPEDPIYFLFSITTGYLLQASISDGALSVILEHLGRISGFAGRTQNFIASANVSNMVIYADIHTNLFEDFRVPRFPYPDLITKRKDRNAAITWGDVAKITEYNVIERLGFTVKGLNAIKYLWQLKDQALLIENTILKGLPTEAYSEFDKLVNAFVRMVVQNEREYIVLKGRLGLLDGRKWTLEELGQREHLTRERIRQIEKKLLPKIGRPKALERLNYLWLAVDETLRIGGGVCCVAEIAESLRNCWKWQTLPSDEALASIISLSANYEVVWAAPIRFIMPNHKCVNCSEIGPVLTRAVESQPNGILSFDESIEIMQEFCQCQPCNGLSETHRFSRGFFHFLDDAIEEILADETNLYTHYAWGVKYGMRRTALVEQIIFNAGKAMHFKEVHAEANKDRPTHGQLSDRSIHGNLERSPALLLWGPGTFIHKELVTIPVSLISEIENDIILRLNTHNIPYLSITGLFEGYKNKLIVEGIPNAQALYSCIRITNHQRIDCPDYPYVLRQESGGQRLPIPLVLEAFVLEQDGVVTLDEIKSFAIEKLCVNEAVFMVSHLPSIPNLLRIDRYEYIHLNQLAIEKDTLSPIIDHLIKLLEKYDHVSTILLYEQKKISCRLLGISTPMLLFSLVQLFYSDQFDLTRYPQIRISVAADDNRTAGVSSEVLNYIRDKALPCSFIELYQYFVEELGYKQYSVHNVLYTYKNLLRYSEGVIVHFETIGWTEEKQAALETLATNHLSHRKSIGKPYGLISHLYDYFYDKLPELPDQISWTPTLIGDLLSSGGRYRIIGTQRNAFVSVPNSYNIESLDDLLYYVLDTNYDGAAHIEQFISDMREAGILIKSITAIMLGADSRVVIDGNVVKLAGLSNRVEET